MQKTMDIFPAVLRLAPPGSVENITDLAVRGDAPPGTRKLDRARAVIVRGTLYVAVDSPTGPQVVFREKVEEQHHEKKISHVKTVSGKIIVITKDENCGCGSRLRGWNPFGFLVSSSEDPSA
jgi:hypothetical protein